MSQTDPKTAGKFREERKPEVMRVLIVDDDRTSRTVLRRILESIGGLEVVEANDGWKAWEVLNGGLSPGLCFFDINMPHMSGLELLQRIRSDTRLAALKVCFCSAVRDRQIILQAAAFQPDYYILKPYARAMILARVQKVRGDGLPSRSLASADTVCARLGIDKETYLSKLHSLRNDLRTLTTRVPTLLTQFNILGANVALEGAKSTAKTLGADRAVNLIDHLIVLVQSSGNGVGEGSSSKEETPANLVKWLARSTDQLFQSLGELRQELDCLDRFAAEIHKPANDAKDRAGNP